VIASDLLDIERELLRVADDIEDRDEWNDQRDSCAQLRDLARRIAAQVETSRLRAA
jgi:hypothetical protein